MAETIVQPNGRLDSAAVPGFERQLADVSFLGNERLLVDLSRVSFIGSAALRAILATAKRLNARDGRLVVFAPMEIAQVFAVSGLNALIPVHLSLAQAREALAGSGG